MKYLFAFLLVWLIAPCNAIFAEEKPVVTIDKIVISVKDLDAMAAFYTKTFGATLKEIDMGGGMKMQAGSLGGLELILCPCDISGVKVEANSIQLRFVVADIEAVHKAALAAGGSAISERSQTDGKIITWDVRDPDGNSIELIQK